MENTCPKIKLDHMMIRVLDLQKSIDFYTNILGMKVVRSRDYPDGKFTNVFLSYGQENVDVALELTHNWERTEPYDKGTAYGHIAFVVEDLTKTMEYLKEKGVKIKSGPKKMNYGTRMLGFIYDPDDYLIELVEPISKDQAV